MTLRLLALLAALAPFPAAACTGTLATWYDYPRARWTASGERFDVNAMTAASPTLPFGTRVRVRYRGRSVEVRITDRMPARRDCRVLDLTLGAFRMLGDPRRGVLPMRMEIVR